MNLNALQEKLKELRDPTGLRSLMDEVPKGISASESLARWMAVKELIVMELGVMAMLEAGCNPSVWAAAKGGVKESCHRMILSVVENRLQAAILTLQDDLARKNLTIASEGLQLARENATIASDGARAAKRGAWAAGLSAVWHWLPFCYRWRESIIKKQSPSH